MKYLLIFIISLTVAGSLFYYYYSNNPYFQNKPVSLNGKVSNMTIQSSEFKNGQAIPQKFTCDGENINPPLTFNNVPYGTKSLALIMDDPDSPNKDFTHWVMFNIEPNLSGISENYKSVNVTLGKNDFGNVGYGGPCPQIGNHKYSIRLYALNTILLLQKGTSKIEVLSNIKGHVIEEAEITGTYKKL